MQQSNDSKAVIDTRITETCNNKRRKSLVGITTEKQSIVAGTITVFLNAHRD